MQGSSDDVSLADDFVALAFSDTDEQVGGADARFRTVGQVEYSIEKTTVHNSASDLVSFVCRAESAGNQAPTTRDCASAESTTRS
jgi:hypothetical protein